MDGVEPGLCSCLKWGEITLHVLLVLRPRADGGHPQQKEAQSKARMKCDISRRPPGRIWMARLSEWQGQDLRLEPHSGVCPFGREGSVGSP